MTVFKPLDMLGLRYHTIPPNHNSQLEYYSIGDVHGCSQEFLRLIGKIKQDASSRNKRAFIICHGDLIDRGPSFSEVLNIAMNFCDVVLLGNHEHNFVLERLGKPCNSNSRKVSHDKFELFEKSAQTSTMSFLNRLYNFSVVHIGDRTFFLSHAPLKNMESYTDWKEYLHIGNAPFFFMRSSIPIDEDMKLLDEKVTFVYGHQSWEFKELEEQKHDQAGRKAQYYNIDAGCVYGGKLVALRLSDLGELFVNSKVKVAKH